MVHDLRYTSTLGVKYWNAQQQDKKPNDLIYIAEFLGERSQLPIIWDEEKIETLSCSKDENLIIKNFHDEEVISNIDDHGEETVPLIS